MRVQVYFGMGGICFSLINADWMDKEEPDPDCGECEGEGVIRAGYSGQEHPCDECVLGGESRTEVPEEHAEFMKTHPWRLMVVKPGDYEDAVYIYHKSAKAGDTRYVSSGHKFPEEPPWDANDLRALEKLCELVGMKYERPGWGFVITW